MLAWALISKLGAIIVAVGTNENDETFISLPTCRRFEDMTYGLTYIYGLSYFHFRFFLLPFLNV